jgi:predicted glycosyltransferase
MRFFFYSHDGFGLGHTWRNLAIARSLTRLAPRAAVLLGTGSDDVMRFGVPDRVEVLKVPGLRKLANEKYGARHLRVPASEVRYLRSRLFLGAIESFRPEVLLVDKHPFGAGGELNDALAASRQYGAMAVLGLRDILDEPATVRTEWQAHQLPEKILEHFDSVLVYGQRELVDSAGEYGFSAELASRTRFCGYVVNRDCALDGKIIRFPLPPQRDPAHPLVLATVGGGEDGFALLQNFLLACRDGWRSVPVCGPMMPDDQQALLAQFASDSGINLYSFVPGLNHWFAAADAVVCMGGYNTIAQTLAAATPVVCVPRVQPRREQLIRAEMFARRGLVRLVRPNQLSPERLRDEIDAALATPRSELCARIRATVQFNGAEIAAKHLLALAGSVGIQFRRNSKRLAVA